MSNYYYLNEIASRTQYISTRFSEAQAQQAIVDKAQMEVDYKALMDLRNSIVNGIEKYRSDLKNFNQTNIDFVKNQVKEQEQMRMQQEMVLNVTKDNISRMNLRVTQYEKDKLELPVREKAIYDSIKEFNMKVDEFNKKYPNL